MNIEISKILDDLGLSYQEVGKDYRTKCWYHEEKDPSMFINKETGVYHCFSCDASGSIFSIVSELLDLKTHQLMMDTWGHTQFVLSRSVDINQSACR